LELGTDAGEAVMQLVADVLQDLEGDVCKARRSYKLQ
jgi:hypothetical protein